MRKFILIAGFVLASAAAQAGDRSLSLAGSETCRPLRPPPGTDASKSAEAAEAPKYVERPAVVEPKADSKAETSRTETVRPRAARMHRPAARARECRTRKADGPENGVHVEEREAARRALPDRALHRRTAPARHLLVIVLPSLIVMPGLVPGIHVLAMLQKRKTWMVGHRRAEATPSFRRLRPAMTVVDEARRLLALPILTAKPSAPRC